LQAHTVGPRRMTLKNIKAFYADLRIKYKMFLLISIVLIVFSVGGISILQYAFHIYNDEIYRQSAQSLNVSSISIENELKEMERLSYQVSTDQTIQDYLVSLNDSEREFDRFIIGTKLRNYLSQVGALNKYVDSIQVYDLNDDEYKVGNHMITLPRDVLGDMIQSAREKKGRAEWIPPSDYDDAFGVARDVRYYKVLTLEHLGITMIRFDMDQIISDVIGDATKDQINLVIFNEDEELVYSMNDELPAGELMGQISDDVGYSLVDLDVEQYFTTYRPSKYMNWTYVILSPYNSLFTAITSAKRAIIVTYMILFLVLMLVGMRSVSNITHPIESLNRKMKRVQTGELTVFGAEEDVTYPKDELGEMHENFQTMMGQINWLIKENYQKQIAIKDSEFKTLQAQINPHFLYNTLDSINWAARVNGQKKISEIAESLGYLMRTAIDTTVSLISVEDELKIVNSYITIQSYRFEERLDFKMDVPDVMMHTKIPKFALQPLIENSIQYGLQNMVDKCEIRLQGRIVEDHVELTVTDNGPGMKKTVLEDIERETYEAHESKGTGLGIRNIRDRIQLLFGDQYGLTIVSEEGKGTKVCITIPYKGG